MIQKMIHEIPGMSTFKGYYVTSDGDVFSTKYSTDRRLSYNDVGVYKTVRLSNGKGVNTTFYVHKLVALAFLPNPSKASKVRHKNKNTHDNDVQNLQWIVKKKIIRRYDSDKRKEYYEKHKNQIVDPSCLIVNKELSDRIRLIHYACMKKGIKTPIEDYDFFYQVLNESLDEYINRYGLRKTMYQIENS